jgi:tricorn protease
MLRILHLPLLTLLCTFSFTLSAQEEARLLRFPTVSETHIVFTYGGDLYSVARAGGVARKITNDEGFEMFAKFSPDGRWVAFTGQYDGNTEVYLIPAEGGNPKRLTYTATLGRDDISDRMGPNNIVMGWTPDGKHVLFRSRMYSFNSFKGQLFKVSVDGGMPEELPFATAGFASYSPDGKKIAFNKVFREFRTWKYYKGGMADEVRIFDFETKEMRKITDNPAQDMQPMWHGNTVYFLSDRDRTMNLFALDLNTGQTRKMTSHTDYDVKFPSLGAGAIAYEQAGYIHLLDLATGRSSKVSIRIHDDRLNARNRLVDASKFVNGFEVSPGGERVLFNARGDVWTVPAENGITRNLTQSSGSHERNATWSPDGRWIAYISDASGEDEIYIVDPKREKAPVKLTSGADTYKYDPEWSPDSKKLLWGDKKNRLQYVDIDSRQVTQVATGESWEIRNYTWSPDSRWVAFTMPEWRTANRIWLYNTASRELAPVTDPGTTAATRTSATMASTSSLCHRAISTHLLLDRMEPRVQRHDADILYHTTGRHSFALCLQEQRGGASKAGRCPEN